MRVEQHLTPTAFKGRTEVYIEQCNYTQTICFYTFMTPPVTTRTTVAIFKVKPKV